jgi:hypothetical protein
MEETARLSGKENVEFVDVYSFFLLMECHIQSNAQSESQP